MPEADVQPLVEPLVDVMHVVGVLGVAGLLGVLASPLLARVVFRLSRADDFAREARTRCRWLSRTTLALVAMLAATPLTDLAEEPRRTVVHVLLVAAIVSGTATLLRLTGAAEQAMLARYDLATEDNAFARGRHTRITIARRLVSVVLLVAGIGAVLLTFESARTVGTSLLASAGIAGVVAGVAAQSTLGNVVAGIQLLVAEPLSLDDVVVVEGEWGNIEQITLTYVVVRTWDRRRLVLPTSYFVSTPFENWTRHGSQVIGAVTWELDHRTPVDALRAEFHRQVEAHPLWDGDVAVVQVIDTTSTTISVRGLVTARNASHAWDLRCAVREGVVAWLVATHPEALPATRLLDAAEHPAPDTGRAGTTDGRDPSGAWTVSPGPDTPPSPDPGRTGEWPAGPTTPAAAAPRSGQDAGVGHRHADQSVLTP